MSVVKGRGRSGDVRAVLDINPEAEVSVSREVLTGVTIAPRVIETAAGKAEFDLTEGEGAVVLTSHGGIGGVDQARIMLGWLDPACYRLLSVSRPGYLNTPLASGRRIEEQADLFAAVLDALGVEKAAVVTLSAGGRRDTSSRRATPTESRLWLP